MNIETRLMTPSDVDAVHAIELLTFAIPWSHDSFVAEVTTNQCARYIVITEDSEIVGYAGMWLVLDEGHITNIAIRADKRGRGLGERVTRALIQLGADTGLRYMTLEVRRSNLAAKALYKKLGFIEVGYRKRYYADNNEDALIMALERLPEADPDADPFIINEE